MKTVYEFENYIKKTIKNIVYEYYKKTGMPKNKIEEYLNKIEAEDEIFTNY